MKLTTVQKMLLDRLLKSYGEGSLHQIIRHVELQWLEACLTDDPNESTKKLASLTTLKEVARELGNPYQE